MFSSGDECLEEAGLCIPVVWPLLSSAWLMNKRASRFVSLFVRFAMLCSSVSSCLINLALRPAPYWSTPAVSNIQRFVCIMTVKPHKWKTVPLPCLSVFVVAYHSLPNFLFGFELRLSRFITGLNDWNKDCPLFFSLTDIPFSRLLSFFFLTVCPSLSLVANFSIHLQIFLIIRAEVPVQFADIHFHRTLS